MRLANESSQKSRKRQNPEASRLIMAAALEKRKLIINLSDVRFGEMSAYGGSWIVCGAFTFRWA